MRLRGFICAAASVYRPAMARQSPHRDASGSEAIEVFAPARLHLGFLDLNGGLGRRVGSIGLAIEEYGVRLRVARAAPSAAPPQRARELLARAADRLGAEGPLSIEVGSTIPEHAGLGSGTQLGLAIACGVSALAGTRMPARSL